MSTKAPRPQPSMKQASLSFVSKRPSNTADGKEKQAKSPAASAVGPSNAHPVIDLAESEIEDAGDTTPAPMEDVEQVSDGESDAAPAATSKRGAKAAATRKERGRKDDEDEIQDSEEEEQEQEPPKKKRRVAARSAKTKAAAVEIPDEEEAAPAKKGKGKRKGKQSLAKSVFRSREGAENSESTKEDWATESKKIKITVKGSGKGALAKHVNVEEMRRHFGYVREKMGNVKPIHAENQSMEDHILRFFDLSYEYGPCIGVTRLQRWQRADVLGLDPPAVVKQLLTNEDGTERAEVKQCVFFGEV